MQRNSFKRRRQTESWQDRIISAALCNIMILSRHDSVCFDLWARCAVTYVGSAVSQPLSFQLSTIN